MVVMVRKAIAMINGHGPAVRSVGIGATLLALTGYLVTEVYGNLKDADVRLEGQLIAAVNLLRDDAKERRVLDEKRWDKQNDVNDAMVRALESIHNRAERKP